jgi:Fic family protein
VRQPLYVINNIGDSLRVVRARLVSAKTGKSTARLQTPRIAARQMRLPRKPPDLSSLLTELSKRDSNRFVQVIGRQSGTVDEQGRYLHWDEMRFKKMPGDLTPEEVWMGTRMARSMTAQRLPLTDAAGTTFSYCEPPSLKASLRNLDMNAGGSLASDVNALSSGDGRLYLARSLAEEPFASSLIEGAATTRQIAKKLIFEGRAPLTKDERMVINNYRALEFVKAHRSDPLSVELILETHRIITDGTLPSVADAGRIRTSNDVQVVDGTSGDILHDPPDYAELGKRLDAIVKFANQEVDNNVWIHPIIKAIILHFMIGYEHPFVDGNGRLARALFYWSALKDGYWLVEYVSISSIIAEEKIQYGKSYLHTESDSGDTTYFVLYNLKILERAVERLGEYVNRRRAELLAFEKRIADSHIFNHRQTWILNEIARNRSGAVTIADHQERNGVSYLTARNDLETLVALSLLRKEKVGRTSNYVPVRDLVRRLTSTSVARAVAS